MKLDRKFIWLSVALIIYLAIALFLFNANDMTKLSNLPLLLLALVTVIIPFNFLIMAKPRWLQGVAIYFQFIMPLIIIVLRMMGTQEVDLDSALSVSSITPAWFGFFILISRVLCLLIFVYAVLGMRISYTTRILCMYYIISFIIGFLPAIQQIIMTKNALVKDIAPMGALLISAILAYPIQYLWERKRISVPLKEGDA